MKSSLRAYLDLVRLPNLFTAAADPLAGYLYAGGELNQWSHFAPLMLASVSLYAGGVALNDVCDVQQDARERPRRPIPSGRISHRHAIFLAIALLLIGVMLAALVSLRATFIAAGLVVPISVYDVVLKRTLIAPAVMGICRALNLGLGLSHSSDTSMTSLATIAPLVFMWLYVASITYFARTEAVESRRDRLLIGAIGIHVAVLALFALPWVLNEIHREYVFLTAGFFAIIGYRSIHAVQLATPDLVQRAVKTFVVSIILFDACLAMAARGLEYGLFVLTLLIPTILIGKWFRVT